MKYGGHIYLWTDHWSTDQLDLFDRARDLGLDCLEIAVGDDIEFDAAAIHARAEALDMQIILSPGAVWPMEADISHDDPDCRARGVAWHRHWISQAAAVGAIAYTGAIYGHAGRIERRRPPADELARTAENLHVLAEHARGGDVQLAIEPMSHFRTHLINTPEQAMRLIEMADSPQLKLLLDTYHLVTEIRDYGAAIRTAGDRLWAIHACENDRGVPGGGVVPWEDIFAALSETRFDDYIVFETYNSALDDFAFTRGMFHNVCPDGDRFVRQALEFVQSGLSRAG